MPSKARPAAETAEKPAEPTDSPPATTATGDAVAAAVGDDLKAETSAGDPPATDPGENTGDGAPPEDSDEAKPLPGVYRFTWPYACNYLLPDRKSTPVEPGTEVFWPNGAPDALWEFVSDEPAPAPSDNTPRE